MRRTTEFATWLTARWPALVRSLVFLGHPPAEAEDAAREAVARVLPAWERERRDGDVDLLAYRAVVEEHTRAVRRRDPDRPTAPAEELDLPPGLADRFERRRELEAHLATLDEEQRVRAVLVHVAGLDDAAADEVVGVAGTTPPLPMSPLDVRDAGEAVPVAPAPVPAVLARSRSRRRTAWGRGAAVAAVVAVVLGATTWWTSGDDDGGRAAPGEVHSATNPLPVPWFADGTLHLARVTVTADRVRTLLEVPDGVVYADAAGHVVHVDNNGRQHTIGEAVPGSRLAVEPTTGWVAWADPGEGLPDLVVYDTLARTEVGRRPLTPPGSGGGEPLGTHGPIAIDGERVYYSSTDGDFAWEPAIDVSYSLSGTMVDTAADARVSLSDGVLRVTPLPYRTGTAIDADDARLTDDGRFAFGKQSTDAYDQLQVFRVENGRPVRPMYAPSDEAVAWAYRDGTFYFVVTHMLQDKRYQDTLEMPSEGDYRFYACRLDRPQPCEKLALTVPEEVADPPVLPS